MDLGCKLLESILIPLRFFVFQPMTDDDLDRIATCLRVLAERSPLMNEIFNSSCRESLSMMLTAKAEEDKEQQRVNKLVRVWV